MINVDYLTFGVAIFIAVSAGACIGLFFAGLCFAGSEKMPAPTGMESDVLPHS